MANKVTVSLTKEQYENLINTLNEGGAGFRANNRIATALVIEANLGLRIEDVLQLRLKDILRDGSRYRLNIVEEKTKKRRTFTVPFEIYQYLENYCFRNNIAGDELIFPVKERNVQKLLAKAADYLGYENIGTHSFRKFYATKIYNEAGHDIALVQQLLQHSTSATTRRYIGISEDKIENAIKAHLYLL